MSQYKINIEKSNEFYNAFVYRTKNDYNQQLRLDIYETIYSPKDKIHYSIIFYICNKRKNGFQSLKQVGKDGIKSLIWAKQCIINFIEHIKTKPNMHGLITVYWDDKKRKDVYVYGLGKIGFVLNKINNQECLIYKF